MIDLVQLKMDLCLNICWTGNEIPGSIRVYGINGCIQDLLSFTSGGEFTQSTEMGSLEMKGTRHTALGTNMYVLYISNLG